MPRIGTIVLLFLVLGGASFAAFSLLRPKDVRLILVARGDAAEVVYATGAVEPLHWAKVIPLQRKRLVEVCDCEGKHVALGESLAKQESTEEQALVSELEARRTLLESDYRRLSGLFERSATSLTAVDQANTAMRENAARIVAAKDRLSALELRSPMDGLVLRQDFHLGEIVGPGDVLFWVGKPRPLRIVSDVNEEDIARVKTGQVVLLRNDGFPGQVLKGHVGDITPKGDPNTKTFRVYITLPDDTPLLIGMSVEANIVTREAKKAVLVPVDALRGDAVLTVQEGRVVQRPITIGIRGTRAVEVLDGLAEGDTIISSVGDDIKPGQRVRVRDTQGGS